MISHIGANKHHRQHKFVRRSTKRSEVQSTYNLSRGWMMRRELRCEGLVGRVALATMARSIEGTRTYNGFQILVKLYVKKWHHQPPKKHKTVNSVWFHDLVCICFALGNKSGSFCEAVNCEQSEQEGKFLFAMLVTISWFPSHGFHLMDSISWFLFAMLV